MMIGHPSLRRLRSFALADAAGRGDAGTSRHLERCERCRARVRWIRGIVEELRSPCDDGAPDTFDAIAARVEAGDRVLLPVEPSPVSGATRSAARASSPRGRRLATAALAAMLVLVAVALNAPEAGAERSELWISPEAPRAGATLSLRYRATTRLADEARLIVRARYHTAERGADPRTEAVGRLRREGDDRFEGSITLPDSAVYLVLAVEDEDADFVDSHGERWEVLVHDDDGRPLFEALRARMTDNRRRNTRIVTEAVQVMVERYPDRAASWYLHYGEETVDIPRDAIDSVRAVFRLELARLEQRMRGSPSVDPDELWYLIMFARSLDASEAADRWRAELLERYPTDAAALQQAAFRAAERHRDDVDRYLAALDSIWRVAPDRALQAAFFGWQAAQRLDRPDLLLRWAERLEALRPDFRATNGVAFARDPELRAEGMARLRSLLAELDEPGDERPLASSAADYEADRRRRAGLYLAALGRALLDVGRPDAALDTLDRALDAGWNPDLFRAVAEARLELGDTTSAVEALARLAADPMTSPAFTDSLRRRLGDRASLTAPAWTGAVDAARDEMRRSLLERSVNRAPLRSRLRLRSPAGDATEVRLDQAVGAVTVVAFWSRYCPPSRAQLGDLDRIADRLSARGVRFIGVTDEADGADVAAFLESEGHSFPTYVDPERDARNAFDNRSTPSYVVLDRDGRIRFEGHSPDDIVRWVAVLEPW